MPGCQAVTPEVRAWRCLDWPASKAPAPRISRAVYINLGSDASRRMWMEAQLEELNVMANITAQRFAAVSVEEVSTGGRFASERKRGFNPTPYPDVQGKWTVAGCMLSHLAVLRDLRRHAVELLKRQEVWLILEDDARVERDIVKGWERAWQYLPEEWDLVRLGWWGGSTCTARINEHVDLAWWQDPPPAGPCEYCGSHAYIVNPDAVQRVLRRFTNSKVMHADCLLGAATPPLEDPHEVPPLRAFALRPSLSSQNEDFPSDRTD